MAYKYMSAVLHMHSQFISKRTDMQNNEKFFYVV